MNDLPDSANFTAHELAPGVFALIAERGGSAVSNSAVIDLGDRTLVFDTFQTLQAAEDLLAVTRALTGRSAALVVNSHWHSDHIMGNQVFAGADIVATRVTMELIGADQGGDRDSLAAEIEEWLDALRREVAEAPDPEARARAERSLRIGGILLSEMPRFRVTLPNKLITDRLVVAGAGRTVELLTYGGGHTASDVFAYLPAERIVVAGDLLFTAMHPRVDDGDAASWARILDRMGALEAAAWVPGHGRLGDAGDAAALSGYLQAMQAAVDRVAARGLDEPALGDLPVPPGSEAWEGRFRFAGSVRALAARRAAAHPEGAG